MSKILIASIGTGRPQSNKESAYEQAKYYLADDSDTSLIETPLLISAIKELYKIDKLILLGTSGSDWASLYLHLTSGDDPYLASHSEIDDNYYDELIEIYKKAKDGKYILKTDEMKQKLIPLKETLGDFCCDIVILEYGITAKEQSTNLSIVNDIAELLSNGDEVIFDVSHSFRSLPFYELLVINLAKDIKEKKISIASVTYGMYEAKNRLTDRTPIVDLSRLIHMMEWMKAVEEYNRFGTAYLLLDLLNENKLGFNDVPQRCKTALSRLGDTVTGVEWVEFKNLVKNCIKIKNELSGTDEISLIIGHIFIDIANTFGDKLNDDVLLFIELAKRHYKYRRYIQCSITLVECILDYCALICDIRRQSKHWSWDDEKSFRNAVLSVNTSDNVIKVFVREFRQLNSIRNHLSHGGSQTCDVSKLEHCTRINGTVVEVLEHYLERFFSIIVNIRKDNAAQTEFVSEIIKILNKKKVKK